MSEQNKEIVKNINDSYLKGNFELMSEYLDENIKWNIVGMPCIHGKPDFIKTMEMMEYQNLNIKNIIAEGDFVVVENSDVDSNITDLLRSVKPYTPSSCDIYFIKNGKVKELTTYMVDITINNEQ